jgi:predicted 3-demethylubiquinone-9 3-methyltransferase (glyoxalase superfamily)
MANEIYPCFWFDHNAEEAAAFYQGIFDQSEIVDQNPFVVLMHIDNQRIMLLNGGPKFKVNPSLSLFVNCLSSERVQAIWKYLMQGGKAMIEMGSHPWSAQYGWLQDKYGVTWQISIANKRQDSESITPSLLFTSSAFGKAEAAMNAYVSLFPNSSITTLMHYGVGVFEEGKVLYAEFELNGQRMIAMDGPGVHDYVFNAGGSMVVNCASQAEIDRYWYGLSENGMEEMCGWLVDEFGLSWQIVPANLGALMTDPKRSQRVMKELCLMKKIELSILEKA